MISTFIQEQCSHITRRKICTKDKWLNNVLRRFQVVEISFNDFDVEECCTCDYLEAFNGGSQIGNPMSHWFGTGLACQIRSSGNEVFMHFESDATVSGSGFFGNYRFANSSALMTEWAVVPNASALLANLCIDEYCNKLFETLPMRLWKACTCICIGECTMSKLLSQIYCKFSKDICRYYDYLWLVTAERCRMYSNRTLVNISNYVQSFQTCVVW